MSKEEKQENIPTPLKEKKEEIVTLRYVTLMKKKTDIFTAYELMQRGYTGAMLRSQVNRYTAFLKSREDAGTPIEMPERYLTKWQTKADNNITPAEGAELARFFDMWQCSDLDALCSVQRLSVTDKTLFVWVTANTTESERARLDALMRCADIAPVLEHYQVEAIEWTAERPEPQRAAAEPTMPIRIKQALDQLQTDAGCDSAEFDVQADYLENNHPKEWERIVDYCTRHKTRRTEILFRQWIDHEKGWSDAEKTPTARIEDVIAGIVSAEADKLMRQKTREFYEYYTRQ